MKASPLRPIVRQSAESQALESLREYILSGSVEPGSRLTEIALADQLGIARATLRTGLHRLASEGILVQIPYTGWQVAEFSPDDAWELWTLRGSLEGLAAKLVTQNPDPAVADGIREAYEALESACASGNMQEISQCDYALHLAIIDLSGHTILQRHYQLLQHQVRLFISTSNDYVSDGPGDILEQHRPIVDAILAGDAERAEYEARHHNEAEGKRLSEWLKNREKPES